MYIYTEDDNRLFAAQTAARKEYERGYEAGYKKGYEAGFHDVRMAEVDRAVSHLSPEAQALYHRLLSMMEDD